MSQYLLRQVRPQSSRNHEKRTTVSGSTLEVHKHPPLLLGPHGGTPFVLTSLPLLVKLPRQFGADALTRHNHQYILGQLIQEPN